MNSLCNYTRLFIDHPFKVYMLCLFFYLACIGAVFGLNLMEVNQPHPRDYLVWDHEMVRGYDQETLLLAELDKASAESSMAVRVMSQGEWVTQIVYECECDNILTVEHVRRMAHIESLVLQLPAWPQVCLATSGNDPGCSSASYHSIALLFSNPHTVTEAELNATLNSVTSDSASYRKIKHLFGKEFSSANQQSKIARAIFVTGGPLEIEGTRYNDLSDRIDEQKDHIV